MNNQQRQNLLQLLSGVNFPNINDNIQEAVHSVEEEVVNTEEMRRDYLLGKIITDILNNVNPTISNSTLNDLKGKNFSQLWGMIRWAKKVEYGANKESGELKVITMEDMAFDPRIKEEINKVLGRVNSAAAAGGGGSVAAAALSKAPHKTSIVTLQSKLQNVLPRYANGNRQRFALMTLPELQAELRALMMSTENAGKKEEISKAIKQSKGTKTVPIRQVSMPSRWTMTKQRKGRKGRKTRRSKHRK